ncbi:DNA alkylation repair protein [Paenibacillus sp. EPM92]|uniref:DNA alkylation repair protein n=1 Tax=Paenibacillus sp. EPM92 TaxID=1561195 RepID=UPI0019153A7D|nr:DNA alkylation repair protein [Paenibacillus sp. EPM92]
MTTKEKSAELEPRIYTDKLEAWLRPYADEEKAGPMRAYMRDQFAFLGIRSPELKQLMREFIKEHGIPVGDRLQETLRMLWRLPEREFQYAALVLLDKRERTLSAEHLALLEELIVTKPWWDTVDLLAGHAVGAILSRRPDLIETYADRWINSDSMWLQRTALLFQLRYKSGTDAELLFRLIRQCADSKEFFIRKAIGWALREYSKTDETAVRRFVAETALSPLSAREALKYMDRKR